MFLQAPLVVANSPVFGSGEVQIMVLLLVKLMLLIGALLYLVFAFVVVRQIQVMRSTLITPMSNVIQFLGILHFIFAIGVLVLFAVVL